MHLLPDGGKEYPRNLCRVIDMMNEQCQAQGKIVEERMKLCRNEADLETRALNEERRSYERGLCERKRLRDWEKLETLKLNAKEKQMMMQHRCKNRNNKRRKRGEVKKLLVRPIKFSKGGNTRQKNACKDEECPLCKGEKKDEQSTTVLIPRIYIINDEYLLKAENEGTGGKSVNRSQRDASTAERLKVEEDRLLVLKNTKHSLEFIKKYNSGMITNAWGEMNKDRRGRKSDGRAKKAKAKGEGVDGNDEGNGSEDDGIIEIIDPVGSNDGKSFVNLYGGIRSGVASRTRARLVPEKTNISAAASKKKNKVILQYPFQFDADEAELAEAASGLEELGGDKLQMDELPRKKGKTSSSRTQNTTIRQDDMDLLVHGKSLNDALVDFWMYW